MKKSNKKIRTIEEATKIYLANKKSKLKQSTYSRYSTICERHILPYFKNIELSKMNNKTINEFIQSKLKNGGLKSSPLSPKTVNDITNLLMQIIKPHCNLTKNSVDIEKPTYNQKEIEIFTEVEYNKLKKYLSTNTDNKKLGIITSMLTGIRIGELCALKWENIDLEKEIIVINKTIQRIKITDKIKKSKTKIMIDTPKSKASIRTIPLPTILVEKLKAFKKDNNMYILTGTLNYIEPRIYQRNFKSYLKNCSIKDKRFHTLRHTFATRAVTREMDIKTLSVLLGHSDVSFTMKKYVHPNLEHKREQIEKIAVGF